MSPPHQADAQVPMGDGPTAPTDAYDHLCPQVPTAYVLDHADPFTGVQGAADLLAQAGFTVQPLPLDRDPSQLQGLIFFASFSSELPAYRKYAKEHASALQSFVQQGNVLMQMAQADQTEAVPPFLPTSLPARRYDVDVTRLKVLDPTYPLLQNVSVTDGFLTWQGGLLGWEVFFNQGGYQVSLAGEQRETSTFMEGALGDGRIILSAMAFDKPMGTAGRPVPFFMPIGTAEARNQFNGAFFPNLFQHVRNVCRRNAAPLKITPSASQPTFSNKSFMLAVLPDTQYYSIWLPGIFSAQTGWIAANQRSRNIAYVMHVGDIVENNTTEEWRRAAQSMSLLEGIVPYQLLPGNHDLGPLGNARTRATLMNDHFKYEKFAAWPTFGGGFEVGKVENTYHLFTAGGRDFIIMSLEWGPRDAVVTWADGIMAQHPDRQGILVTHAYMNNNDRRYDIRDTRNPQDFNPHHYQTAGGVNDAEELWQKLVRKHKFILVLSGHVLGDGTGYLASVTDHGNTCHQILANYQFRDFGGEGFMRLMEFMEDNRTVRVFTYSPLYDQFMIVPDQNFTITLDLPPQRPSAP